MTMSNDNDRAMVTRNEGVALTFSAEQRQILRDTFANGATEQEFAVLMEVATQRGLNPFKREIFFVERWDSGKSRMVWQPQVSIDGLRLIAQRTGLYDGQDEPEFVENPDGSIKLCKVRVHRKDWARPAVGVAYWDEYVQTTRDKATGKTRPNSMWSKMPHTMLAKCSEALALRKAFPAATAGLYTPEEMGQADNERPAPKPVAVEQPRRVIDAAPQPLALPRDNGPSPSGAPLPDATPAVEHYDLAAGHVAGAGSLDALRPAWATVTRDHVPHLGPSEKKAIEDAKNARKAALAAQPPAPKPDGDDPTPPSGGPKRARKSAAPADATSNAPAGTEGASGAPAAWLASEDATRAHAAEKHNVPALEASARLHGASLAKTAWGVQVYAERLAAIVDGDVAFCLRRVSGWAAGGPVAAKTQRRAA